MEFAPLTVRGGHYIGEDQKVMQFLELQINTCITSYMDDIDAVIMQSSDHLNILFLDVFPHRGSSYGP